MTETLRDLALAAYRAAEEAKIEAEEAARRKLLEDQSAALRRSLQEVLGLDVAASGPSVEVDDLTFTVLTDDLGHWEPKLHVVNICPQCARRTYSAFEHLVELGKILSDDSRCSTCEEADRTPSAF